MFHKNEQKLIGVIFASLLMFSLILTIWLPFLQALRLIFGIVLLFFIPGFFISEVAFPRDSSNKSHQIDWIERIVLSVALSISTVGPLVYLFNQFGISISTRNILFEIFGLILLLVTTKIFFSRSGDRRTN